MHIETDIFDGHKIEQPQIGTVVSKDEEGMLSRQIFDEYSVPRAEWEKQAKDDDAFRHGDQWDPELKAELLRMNQSPIVVNVIQPAVEQAVGMLTSNHPRFTAAAQEDSDTKIAKTFADLLAVIWNNSLGNMELKKAIDDYYVKGLGCLIAYYDPSKDLNKGEVCIKSLEPYDVYLDPHSKDFLCRDSAHMLIVRQMTKTQIYDEMSYVPKEYVDSIRPSGIRNNQQNAVTQGDYSRLSNGINLQDTYMVTERYTKLKRYLHHVFDDNAVNNRERILKDEEFANYVKQPAFVQNQGGQESFITEPEMVARMEELVVQMGATFHFVQDEQSGQPVPAPGVEDEAPNVIPNSTTMVTAVTIGNLVQKGIIKVITELFTRIKRVISLEEMSVYVEIMPLDEFPIIVIMNRHARNPYPMSDVRFVRPIQEYVNKIRSLIIAHASNSTNVKVFMPNGAVDVKELEEKMSRAGTAVITYDAEVGNVTIAGPIPLPNELYKNEMDARKDIQEILGLYPLMAGDASAAPSTYKGTVAVEEYGQRRIRSKKDDIETSINQLAKVVIQFIQYYYTDHRVYRLLGQSNQMREVSINAPLFDDTTKEVIGKINDITVGRYDITVVAGSMLPSNRWARFEYYMELYKNGIIDQVEVLKQTEVADMEGVLERNSILKQMQQQVASLEETVKNLQGDLQTAQRETLHSSKRLEVEKFKTQLNELKTNASARAKIGQDRISQVEKRVNSEEMSPGEGEQLINNSLMLSEDN